MIQRSATQPSRAQLRSRIELRTARVAVVGLGYVGLPLAEAFALAGFPVVGFDVDPEKVRLLRQGQSYIGHFGPERIAELIRSEQFQPTADPCCFQDADAIVICVPTPLTDSREPDLSYVVSAGRTISKHLRPGQLVVLESTTYPGTTDDVLRPLLEESGLRVGEDIFLAFSPEREDPGNKHYNTRTIPKVIGGIDASSRELAVALYDPVVASVVPVSSAKVAEACKILENTYRSVNIALVNELKVVFEAMGIDVWEVIEAAKTKPFGFQAFYPGPGLGGHCIPIDPFYLTWAARKVGINTRFIELSGEVNSAMPKFVVNRVAEALNDHVKPLRDSRVGVLGAAYKKDVDDARESPALEIIKLLRQRGALVSYHDPHIPVLRLGHDFELGLESEILSAEWLAAQDCVVLVTDHSAYDLEWITRHARLLVDTRNAARAVSAGPCRVYKA